MPRNARCVMQGLAYHVTQRGVNRQRVFYSASDHEYYLGLVRENWAEAAVRVLGYCLMPNHVHFVLKAEAVDSLAVLFRRVHGRYAQYLNVKKQRNGHVWQNRFFSCPLSESHLWTALRYVEQNPVRAGLARRPEEFRWSSATAHFSGKDRRAVLDQQFWLEAGGAERWTGLHASPEELVRLRLLRRCTYAGRPFGEDSFVAALEGYFQRSWRRWSFEAGSTARAASSSGENLNTSDFG